MALKKIDPRNIPFNPFEKVNAGYLITSGDMNSYNTMTASWGFMGIMWGKNVVDVVIRPNRYTYEFMQRGDLFTLSFLKNSEDAKRILAYCGSKSGRDVDKAKETGLVPVEIDGAVTFKQASVVFVCKKMYTGELDINKMKTEYMSLNGSEPIHTQFIGEIIACYTEE
jgi:flavin reductase (DIM6/NTAB) family NADH-FMN oxidoreductase RutF